MAELDRRLRARGQDSEQAITTRLAEAKTDMSQASRYDYLIVNDDFDRAHEELVSIIRASRQLRHRQMQNRGVAALIDQRPTSLRPIKLSARCRIALVDNAADG